MNLQIRRQIQNSPDAISMKSTNLKVKKVDKDGLQGWKILLWGKKLVYEWKIWDICVPHLLENSLMMVDTQNYERHFPVKLGTFFQD